MEGGEGPQDEGPGAAAAAAAEEEEEEEAQAPAAKQAARQAPRKGAGEGDLATQLGACLVHGSSADGIDIPWQGSNAALSCQSSSFLPNLPRQQLGHKFRTSPHPRCLALSLPMPPQGAAAG